MNKLIFEKPLNWKVMPGQEGVAVAMCDELDMVLQIDEGSPEDQVHQIMEAMRLLYDDLEQAGELEAFFAHHNVTVAVQKPQDTLPDFEMIMRTLDIDSPSSKVLA